MTCLVLLGMRIIPSYYHHNRHFIPNSEMYRKIKPLNKTTVLVFDYYPHFHVQVKYWITFNEPKSILVASYGQGYFPPLLPDRYDDMYLSAHYLIKAHAEAYHVYNRSQNGKLPWHRATFFLSKYFLTDFMTTIDCLRLSLR